MAFQQLPDKDGQILMFFTLWCALHDLIVQNLSCISPFRRCVLVNGHKELLAEALDSLTGLLKL